MDSISLKGMANREKDPTITLETFRELVNEYKMVKS